MMMCFSPQSDLLFIPNTNFAIQKSHVNMKSQLHKLVSSLMNMVLLTGPVTIHINQWSDQVMLE